jgi:hypothetical protein
MNRTIGSATSAIVVAGALLAASGPALAADQYATNARISREADTMFRQVSAARTDIRAKNTAGAKAAIAKAIDADNAATTTATENHLALVVPIYSELVQDSVIDQVASHAAHAKAGSTASSSNGRQAARYAVGGNELDLSSVSIDLQRSGTKLQAAQKALDDGDRVAALATLDEIGDDLRVSDVVVPQPLLTARENLAIAHDDLAAHRDAQANAAIAAASSALKRYAANPGEHAAAARVMANDLAQLEPQAAGNRNRAESSLASWWGNVSGWFKTHV